MSDEIKSESELEEPSTVEYTQMPEDYAGDDGQKKAPRQRKDMLVKDGQRLSRFKKKVCRFCHDKSYVIDYKRSDILENFITDRGKILPRRITGTCAKHQRDVAREIKRARIIALLPFVEK